MMIAHPAMKLTSSLRNAARANVAEPPRSGSIASPSAYVSVLSRKTIPTPRKTRGVRPSPRSATRPSAKNSENPTAEKETAKSSGTPR
jgi:hypothetical protein